MGADPYDGRPGLGHRYLSSDGLGLDERRKEERDVEAARDFDEAELDELHHKPSLTSIGFFPFPRWRFCRARAGSGAN